MKIYNSLTNKIEDFVPLNDNIVGIYSCGPTVYNYLHIGNLSAFIYADVLRRALEANGFNVKHVMNITDIDDKTIRDSLIQFPDIDPLIALKNLTDKYRAIFLEDLSKTGNDIERIEFISAVESIPDMIQLTQKLLDNHIAYIADDGVYFSITKYYQKGYKYGVLQKVSTQQSKARVANDEYDKENAGDFALWKKTLIGEPSWPATFSEDTQKTVMDGRPGWHIECSAMSQKTLGVPFDIHTGGIDLKFPHHENEIAQTCGAEAKQLSRYFFHNNHILVEGKKMSKSLNNFYTLNDIEKKGFMAQAFRLLVLESHYHKESNFSWDILSAATNRLSSWQSIADLRWQLESSSDDSVVDIMIEALAQNLDTPQVLKEIDAYFELVQKDKKAPNESVLKFIRDTLGIDLHQGDVDETIKKMLLQRQKSRLSKDWSSSDKIRDELLEQGIIVRDDSTGQIWSRI